MIQFSASTKEKENIVGNWIISKNCLFLFVLNLHNLFCLVIPFFANIQSSFLGCQSAVGGQPFSLGKSVLRLWSRYGYPLLLLFIASAVYFATLLFPFVFISSDLSFLFADKFWAFLLQLSPTCSGIFNVSAGFYKDNKTAWQTSDMVRRATR